MKIAILGRQSKISLAELISLFGSAVEPWGEAAALVDADVELPRLGGTLKIGQIIADAADLHRLDWDRLLAGRAKLTLGLSFYGFRLTDRQILSRGLELKQALRSRGVTLRIVPPAGGALNAAAVLHNRLLTDGLELMAVRASAKTVIAVTEQVQDIEAYGRRDQARPERSAKVGMLPPKLAQIMLNLAAPDPAAPVLDPFCGSGVVLQEALLAGHPAVGSDLAPAMAQAADQNLRWLSNEYDGLPDWQILTGDARRLRWPQPIGAVVSEGYLGPPLRQAPKPDQLRRLRAEIGGLVIETLGHLASQLPPGVPVVMALPAWRRDGRFERLPVVDRIAALGYTVKQFSPVTAKDLIYWRAGQLVGRELLVLRRTDGSH